VTGHLDDQQQRFAAQMQRDHPDWVIMWGYHSRLYWAFPLFNAPKGTVLAAPGPAELTESIGRAELAATLASRGGPAQPPPPLGPEPLPPQSPPARAPAATAFEGAKRPAGGGITEPQARVG
jgi:hypothetical protein